VKRTREEIREVYEAGYEAVVMLFEATIKEMEERIKAQEKRLEELERRLNQNSQNSHRPPSSDGFKRPAPRSQRKKSGRPSGGQAGHEGTRLECAEADEIIEYWARTCSECGEKLEEKATGYTRRQVHDIPPIELHVIEHRAMETRCCGCGTMTAGEYPAGVSQEVQYGNGVKAWLTYASVYQMIPMDRNTEMLEDMGGRRVSEGTVANSIATCAEKVAAIEEKIKAAVIKAEVKHADETSMWVGKERHWLHVCSTRTLTHYGVDKQRGAGAYERIGILPKATGVVVHDRYASYATCSDRLIHSFCNAHILRDLAAIEELTRQAWPGKMKVVLLDMKSQVDQAREAGHLALSALQLVLLEQRYDDLTRIALQSNKKAIKHPGQRGRPRASPARNLAESLRDDKDKIIRFVRDFRVPFDNNLAERDLRMMKAKQKISGTFRSLNGANMFATIRGFVSTARKQGHGALASLRAAFDGRADQLNLAE
jgi:transposase